MSFDLFVSRFVESEVVPFPRAWIIAEFGSHVAEAGKGFLELRFPDGGETCLYLGDGDDVESLCINRRCGSLELETGILNLLRRSTIVVYGPDTPIVVARIETRGHLPADMIEMLGEPAVADDGNPPFSLLFP